MSFFRNLFGKKDPQDPNGPVTVTGGFTLNKNTTFREVDPGAVTALDLALERIGIGQVLHAIDPSRVMAFSSGGPAAWSVGWVPLVNGQKYAVTYGLSRGIDAAASQANIGYELSLRIVDDDPMWAILLLRSLARYIMESGNELAVGNVVPFGFPITHAAMGPSNSADMPDTSLHAVCIVADPDLGPVLGPRGPIEVRRVYGIHGSELQAIAPDRTAGPFCQYVASREPTFTTDLARPPFA